jgi:hypothetical protein
MYVEMETAYIPYFEAKKLHIHPLFFADTLMLGFSLNAETQFTRGFATSEKFASMHTLWSIPAGKKTLTTSRTAGYLEG